MPRDNSTTIAIKGRDDTKKAFASVKRGLGELPPAAQKSTRGLGAAFGKLPPQLQGVGRALKGIGGVLTGPLGIALSAGAATTALGAFARSAVNAADELGKAATRTGLSVEALSSLEVAARQGGTSFGALEKGLARLSRNAVDANDGLAEASRGFDRLGISVTDSNGQLKSTDALYAEIATELSKMEGGTRKTAIAQELFGRSGSKLIPVLNNGATALSNNVTTSTLLARSSEALNDRMDDIRVIFGQVGNAILKGVIPPLAHLLTNIVAGAKSLSQTLAPALTATNKVLGEVGQVVLIVAKHIGNNLLGVFRSAGQFLKAVFGPAVSFVQRAFRGLGNDTPKLGRALRGLAAWFVTVSGRVTELTQRIIGGATAAVRFGQTVSRITRLDFDGARDAASGIGEAWRTAAEQADATRKRTNEAADAIRNGVSETISWNTQSGNVARTIGGVAENLGDKGVKGKVKEVTEETKKQYEEVGSLEAQRFQQYTTNLENARVIEFTNANNKREREKAAHLAKIGEITLEAATQIQADLDVFNRRKTSIENQEEIEKKAQDNYIAKVREGNEELKKREPILNQLSKVLRDGLQSGIEGLIRGTQSWGDALRNIGQNILDTLIKKFSQLATNSIFNIFTGGKNGLGSLFGAGAAGAAGKAAGVGGATKAIGGAVGGLGKALGGVASALAPLAVVAAPFAIGSLFRKGESDETKRRRELATQLDVGAILEGANGATVGYVSRPRGGSHPNRREREARRKSLDNNPERKIQIALSSSIFRNADKDAVRRILEENIDKFRYGGIVNARRGGQFILAGEGGQNEAVVPLPNGRAIPVEIKGGNTGQTVNIVVNVDGMASGSDGRFSQQFEEHLLRAIERGGIIERA